MIPFYSLFITHFYLLYFLLVQEDIDFQSFALEFFVLIYGTQDCNFGLFSDSWRHEDWASDNLFSIFWIYAQLYAYFDWLFKSAKWVKSHQFNSLVRVEWHVFVLNVEYFLSFWHSVLESSWDILFGYGKIESSQAINEIS